MLLLLNIAQRPDSSKHISARIKTRSPPCSDSAIMASQLVPSKLIFLADLPSTQPGDKVRFLGWYAIVHLAQAHEIDKCLSSIETYDSFAGALVLRHEYKGSKHVAQVTIEHVRENLPATSTMTGSWINVVGYVQAHGESDSTVSAAEIDMTDIQATMLWEAGSLQLEDYEKAIEAQKASDLEMKPAKPGQERSKSKARRLLE